MEEISRVLIKVSGEAMSNEENLINSSDVRAVADNIVELLENDIQVAVVVGGGNFWRGRSSSDMDRGVADEIGMLATVMNGLALSDMLTSLDVANVLVSSVNIDKVCRTYSILETQNMLNEGKVVIFVGGTGAPYFSTDTAAVLRACEIHADAVFCSKAIDGIYDCDPKKYPDAIKYDTLDYDTIIRDNLSALDLTATAMAREYKMPLYVYSKNEPHAILRIIEGEEIGTIVK